MNVYLPNGRLPSAYQEVEWIQPSGTQYIDTGYAPTQNTKAVYKLGSLNITTGDHYIFGAERAWKNSGFGVYIGQYGGTNGMVSFGTYGGGTGGGNINDGNIHIGELSIDGYFVDGVNIRTFGSQTFTSINLYLFALNRNGVLAYATQGKMYYFKIYESGTLVRDFVPCYRKSDSVIGLYDLVNNQFYTNSGTGTFTKGSDVVLCELQNAYIGNGLS